jgi:hypothetical protein
MEWAATDSGSVPDRIVQMWFKPNWLYWQCGRAGVQENAVL